VFDDHFADIQLASDVDAEPTTPSSRSRRLVEWFRSLLS